MGEQGAVMSPAVNRKPLLMTDKSGKEKKEGEKREDGGDGRRRNHRRVGEFAGGTTAECAMVCCCCPCAVLDLLVLVLYKVPAGLCRKALRRKKKKRERLLMDKTNAAEAVEGAANGTAPAANGDAERHGSHEISNSNSISADFDSEMWARFNGGGFWRSASRRAD